MWVNKTTKNTASKCFLPLNAKNNLIRAIKLNSHWTEPIARKTNILKKENVEMATHHLTSHREKI